MSETVLSATDTLTPKEAAAILKLSADTVQRMIRIGKLKGIPVAGNQRKRYIVMRSDVAAYLEDRRFEVQADIEPERRPNFVRGGYPMLERFGG